MGIDANLAYRLATTVGTFNVRGTLCTLGVPTIRSENHQVQAALTAAGIAAASDSSMYTRLGFDRVESIDVSDFEGCDHVFDLNTPGVPDHLQGRFDAVYNGGTLEHIFDTRSALRNVFELLTVGGGVVIHVGPANGWLDHGFYQFSPTLLVDYYFANRFDILEAFLIEMLEDQPGTVMVHHYVPGAFDGHSGTPAGRWLFYLTFRKGASSTWDRIPQQRYYTALYGTDSALSCTPLLRYAPPFRLRRGVPVTERLAMHALPTPAPVEGFEWMIHVPEVRDMSDGTDRRSSQLMLFEDGVAIGPPHAPHVEIRTLGAGRYSHWDEWVRLSPSRNDDARNHVYAYAMATHGL